MSLPAPCPTHDLIVVGAGPAGMAAAECAAGLGLSVALVDEQPRPGGQIYRATGASPLADASILGPDYQRGAALVEALSRHRIECFYNATVWQVTRDREIGLLVQGQTRLLQGRAIILATGAMERPVPIPGWTLPGVMTAGAGQILLKSAGLMPSASVVIAGSGPLLFLIAWQYVQAGVTIAAVVETTPHGNYLRALRHLGRALKANEYLRKGVALIAGLKRAGIPILRNARHLRAEAGADGRVARLHFRTGNRDRSIECGLLLLHQGVVPNTQITRALDCSHDWDALQRCWRPRVNEWGATDVPGLWVAGDGAGIAGARAAEHSGRLAALDAARLLDRIQPSERDEKAAPDKAALAHHGAVRPFLDTLYASAPDILVPSDDTILCRCEEVTAGDIRHFVALGCQGPNQAKIFGRSGMGPCQGRLCGLTVAEVIADARGVPMEEVGYYRIRPPIKPITLGQLADLDIPQEAAE